MLANVGIGTLEHVPMTLSRGVQKFVGWAKRSVPTRGHGAKARLCPPYGANQIDREML